LELGSELVEQLGEVAERNLLACWMAEYLAEKLAQAKKAKGGERDKLSADCADLILKLWAHRHALPDGTQPLASFEPLFKVLDELSQEHPRYSLLRNLPPTKEGSEAGKIIAGVLVLDRSAKSLIRYFLAEAVSKIPAKDKRWIKLRAATRAPSWDVQIVLRTLADAESAVEKKVRLHKDQINRVKNMLAAFKAFEGVASALRTLLEDRLSALKKTQDVTK
jgi:hypothetical protein